MRRIGQIRELWRYPVKSMGGERLLSVDLLPYGIAGDRLLALESAAAPMGKPMLAGRERAASLRCRARLNGGQQARHMTDGNALLPYVAVEVPGGASHLATDPALIPALQEYFGTESALWFTGSTQPLTDCRPLALLSMQAMRMLSGALGTIVDPQRFRANILLDFDADVTAGAAGAFPEDALVGKRIRLGADAIMFIKERDPRCRVITLDPVTGEPMPELMRHVARSHDGKVGIYAATETPGSLAEGDPVFLLD